MPFYFLQYVDTYNDDIIAHTSRVLSDGVRTPRLGR